LSDHKLPAKAAIFITFNLFFLNMQWINLGMQSVFHNTLTGSLFLSALTQETT